MSFDHSVRAYLTRRNRDGSFRREKRADCEEKSWSMPPSDGAASLPVQTGARFANVS